MISNKEQLLYISSIVGLPIIYIWNDIEQKGYYYLAVEFKPAIPSNYIFDNQLTGKDISSILTSLGGFSHGISGIDEVSILTKINELPAQKMTFNGFRWIKFQN